MRRIASIVLAAVFLLTLQAAAFAAVPADGEEENEVLRELPGDITVREDSALYFERVEDEETQEESYEVRGLVAQPAADAMREELFLEMFVLPDGIEGTVLRGDVTVSAKEIVATGDTVVFALGEEVAAQATVVVAGDVIGSGIMSLAQLVRLAGALSGTGAELTGPYLAAADLDGSGILSLSDLVRESELLAQSMRAMR